MMLRAGQEAVVRVNVATLWTRPEAVRPVDTAALATHPEIPRWIAGLTPDERVGDCVLTQLLFGERVLIEEVRPDGWVRLIAIEQPAGKLDSRGYPGWLPAGQLVAATDPPPASATPADPLVVDATTTTRLHARPDGEMVLPGVILGTRLTPAGPPQQGWQPVWAPGHDRPLWARDADLAPAPTGTPDPTQVLAVASRLLNVPYLWGGVSAYGIDCSGLVHLAWRRFGVRLPRDADDQARATTALLPGAEQPGDLYFFARPGRPIHHIGIVSARAGDGGNRRMLHACYTRRWVLEEPMPAERLATLVGAHRV